MPYLIYNYYATQNWSFWSYSGAIMLRKTIILAKFVEIYSKMVENQLSQNLENFIINIYIKSLQLTEKIILVFKYNPRPPLTSYLL